MFWEQSHITSLDKCPRNFHNVRLWGMAVVTMIHGSGSVNCPP